MFIQTSGVVLVTTHPTSRNAVLEWSSVGADTQLHYTPPPLRLIELAGKESHATV